MTKFLAAVLCVWTGLLLGVSFVATPAKFLAPSLTMPVALDVGRWTFHVLAWIEWSFVAVAAVLIAAAWRTGQSKAGLVSGLMTANAVVLATETFILRPMLDEQVLRIIAGESVVPSYSHNLYIALEATRILLILAAGAVTLRRL